MSKYTKAERHEIYKKALENFHIPIDNGLCCVISYIIYGFINNHDKVDRESFPELYLFKRPEVDYYWLSDEGFGKYTESGNELRKTVLEFCIYMSSK